MRIPNNAKWCNPPKSYNWRPTIDGIEHSPILSGTTHLSNHHCSVSLSKPHPLAGWHSITTINFPWQVSGFHRIDDGRKAHHQNHLGAVGQLLMQTFYETFCTEMGSNAMNSTADLGCWPCNTARMVRPQTAAWHAECWDCLAWLISWQSKGYCHPARKEGLIKVLFATMIPWSLKKVLLRSAFSWGGGIGMSWWLMAIFFCPKRLWARACS